MELLLESINRELEDLKRNEVSLDVIGDLSALPKGPREALEKAIVETADNKRLKLVLAISYSGRSDIVSAVNKIISAGVSSVDEDGFADYLSTADYPHPDLLIRTSGEFRLSNFLLYEVAYSEIFVTEKYWPDFSLSREHCAVHLWSSGEEGLETHLRWRLTRNRHMQGV